MASQSNGFLTQAPLQQPSARQLFTESESKTQDLDVQENAFRESVAEYCRIRNSQAKKIDLLRELRRQAEQQVSSFNQDELDNFDDIIRDVHVSLDDAVFQLEKHQNTVMHNCEIVTKMKMICGEVKSNGLHGNDFDQRKKMEILREKYQKALEHFAQMNLLLEKITSLKDTEEANIKRATEFLDVAEQKNVNDTTQKISNAISKLSSKIVSLQRQMRDNKIVKNSQAKNINQAMPSNQPITQMRDLNRSVGGNTSIATTYTMCLEETDDLMASLRLTVQDSIDGEEPSKMQKNLLRLMNIRKEIPIRQVNQTNIFPIPTSTTAKSAPSVSSMSANDKEIVSKIKQSASPSSKPKLVSVSTQSPVEWMKQTKSKDKSVISQSASSAKASIFTPTVQQKGFPKTSTPISALGQPTKLDFGQQANQKQPTTPISKTEVTQQTTPLSSKISPATTQQPNPLNALTPVSNAQVPISAVPQTESTSTPVQVSQPLSTTGVGSPPVQQPVSTLTQPTIATTTSATTTSTIEPTMKPATPSASTFSFKPPTTIPATPPNTKTSAVADDGMEDDLGSTTAPAASKGVSFNFNSFSTGLGSSTPTNATKNAFGGFGGGFAKPTQQQVSANSWLFGGGSNSVAATNQTTPTKPSLFQNTAGFGSPSGTGFGSGPSFGSKSAFGGGPAFGGSAFVGGGSSFGGGPSALGGSAFGGGAPIASNPQSSNLATGFSAFANKSSAFGQLAQQAGSPSQQSVFGSPQGSGSLFGGASSPNQNIGTTNKSLVIFH
ncbi:nuclear pore complex protein [Ditylenchus destructor]|uniref:Nuclear pore complex protein n=1 Tax=Ditylenchus destructor TaxID=166010 RepID=A0AAD4N4E0_9BILA|nr:nuclear pore complex protein [Ditylenchus destructor]